MDKTKELKTKRMNKNLKLDIGRSGIARLVLSQPDKRNALTAAMWRDLPDVLKQVMDSKGVKVLIVSGQDSHFASGADISEFEQLYATSKDAKKTSKAIADGMQTLARFPLPTIAMIRGACVGGGCGLALCCDLRFADTSAKFAITPAKLGLVYPFADVQRLIETVGIAHAKDILFSARIILSKEALHMRLVNSLHPPEDLENAVMEYAKTMTRLSTESAMTTKKMFKAYQAGQRREDERTKRWYLDAFSSQDFKEGYEAFLQKRKPDFS